MGEPLQYCGGNRVALGSRHAAEAPELYQGVRKTLRVATMELPPVRFGKDKRRDLGRSLYFLDPGGARLEEAALIRHFGPRNLQPALA